MSGIISYVSSLFRRGSKRSLDETGGTNNEQSNSNEAKLTNDNDGTLQRKKSKIEDDMHNTTQPATKTEEMVVIPYASLLKCLDEKEDEDGSSQPDIHLLQKIGQAYNYNGTGILAVSGVPGLNDLRMNLLPQACKFANLPDNIKKETEVPHAFYQVGWSHGNEKLQGNKPDYAKGSYYGNPLVDVPSTDKDLIAKYPSFLEPNIWPKKDAGLPEFESSFKEVYA